MQRFDLRAATLHYFETTSGRGRIAQIIVTMLFEFYVIFLILSRDAHFQGHDAGPDFIL